MNINSNLSYHLRPVLQLIPHPMTFYAFTILMKISIKLLLCEMYRLMSSEVIFIVNLFFFLLCLPTRWRVFPFFTFLNFQFQKITIFNRSERSRAPFVQSNLNMKCLKEHQNLFNLHFGILWWKNLSKVFQL